MKRICFALLVAFSAVATTSALAQTYPNRTIRIVVPYAPGGGVSVYANLISGKLSEIVKQSVVVENRPGAGGNVGSDVVAKSPPDGYTVLLHTSALASAGPLYKSLPFDPIKDFAPVTNVVHTQMIVAGSLKSTATTLPELIAEAKAKPGTLNYASSGLGSSLHLFAEIFKNSAGVDILHIPYRGDAPMITAMIAGDVQMAFLPQATGRAAACGRLRSPGGRGCRSCRTRRPCWSSASRDSKAAVGPVCGCRRQPHPKSCSRSSRRWPRCWPTRW
jgi:tripartite-type tricarboxylate transporter receptor subunit TctC